MTTTLFPWLFLLVCTVIAGSCALIAGVVLWLAICFHRVAEMSMDAPYGESEAGCAEEKDR